MDYTLHYRLKQFIPTRTMPLGIIHMPSGKEARKKFHNHNYSEIVLILGGTGIHFLGGKQCKIKTGDVLVIHPEISHAYDSEDMELVNIIYDSRQLMLPILDGTSLALFRKFFPDSQSSFCGQVDPVLTLSPEEMKNMFDMILHLKQELESCRSGCNLCSLALFIEIIIALCRLFQKNDQKDELVLSGIGEVLEYLNTHYQQQVSIDQLARTACRSRRNFFLHFRNTVGCSPIQYLIRIRISRAIELLLYTELPIYDIAIRCGFSDSNYFCKVFHAQTGVSPRHYRLKNHS